jgi:hypothetical protein
MPSGQAARTGEYRTARVYTTPAHFTSDADARFPAITQCFADAHAVACEFAAA